ncbi:RNA 2'-phosphotransferase [Kribbella deserti]|uniref:RNA 2'-phosphotransferase n=1 Tax=Kribbella deserti TaxID=1926257 RepID=A0ABV6QSY3_9ACTN
MSVVRHSKAISKLLRHTAGERGLAMTPDGWSSIDDVCALLCLTRQQLDEAVAQNDKKRLQVDGDRIRACQGHSRLHMPVTLEALEASVLSRKFVHISGAQARTSRRWRNGHDARASRPLLRLAMHAPGHRS